MYACVATITDPSADRPTKESDFDHLVAVARRQKGFTSATPLVEDATSKYTFLTLWESLGQAEHAVTILKAERPGWAFQATPAYAPGSSAVSTSELSFLIAEHKPLRDEIIKRLEMQHQLVSGVLVAAGTLLAIGIKDVANLASGPSPTSKILLLLYPILATFVGLSWNLHNRTINTISEYIRSRIEKKMSTGVIGWEHYHPQRGNIARFILSSLSTFWIIVGTQVLAITMALSIEISNRQLPTDPLQFWLLIADIISIILILIVIPLAFRVSRE
jgi:hypothetical protein